MMKFNKNVIVSSGQVEYPNKEGELKKVIL